MKLAFSLAVAELTLYLVHFPAWWGMGDVGPLTDLDHDLGWVNRPGVYEGAFDKSYIKVTTLPDRSRQSAPEIIQKAGPKLILVGDSFIFGYGVNDSDALGWKLNERIGDSWIVVNRGVPRYGTVQSYLTIKQIISESHQQLPIGSKFIYLLNTFHEERNVGSLIWRSVWSRNEVTFPSAHLDSSGQLNFELAPSAPIPLPARIFRTCALFYENYRAIVSKKALFEAKDVTEKVLQLMQKEAESIQGDFEVVLFDGSKDSLSEYGKFMADQHIKFIDCSILGEKKEAQYRIPDGHPNGLLYSELADCIIKNI